MEFKGTKEEKALKYAKEIWGDRFDEIDNDCAETKGEYSKQDFLKGYEIALKDSKAPEMLEMLESLLKGCFISNRAKQEKVKELIKKATEI